MRRIAIVCMALYGFAGFIAFIMSVVTVVMIPERGPKILLFWLVWVLSGYALSAYWSGRAKRKAR